MAQLELTDMTGQKKMAILAGDHEMIVLFQGGY